MLIMNKKKYYFERYLFKNSIFNAHFMIAEKISQTNVINH